MLMIMGVATTRTGPSIDTTSTRGIPSGGDTNTAPITGAPRTAQPLTAGPHFAYHHLGVPRAIADTNNEPTDQDHQRLGLRDAPMAARSAAMGSADTAGVGAAREPGGPRLLMNRRGRAIRGARACRGGRDTTRAAFGFRVAKQGDSVDTPLRDS
jgi:hypothetical protein